MTGPARGRRRVWRAAKWAAPKSAGPGTHDAPRSQKTVNSKGDAVFFELCRVCRGTARGTLTSRRWCRSSMSQCRKRWTWCRASMSQWSTWSSSFLKNQCSNVLVVKLARFWSQTFLEGLEQLVPQVRVQPRTDEHIHGLEKLAFLLQVQQRTAEQVVDVHLPLPSGFGRFVEQVVDVPVRQRAHAHFASIS